MNDVRLSMLERMAQSDGNDPFPRYGLALEYRKLGRHDEALAAFGELVRRHPDYVPAYLMFGNFLRELGRPGEAADVYARGISVARSSGDAHALGELEGALAELGHA